MRMFWWPFDVWLPWLTLFICIETTTAGGDCVFPFTYQGTEYQACTDTPQRGAETTAWCVTDNNDPDNAWGYCGTPTVDPTGIICLNGVMGFLPTVHLYSSVYTQSLPLFEEPGEILDSIGVFVPSKPLVHLVVCGNSPSYCTFWAFEHLKGVFCTDFLVFGWCMDIEFLWIWVMHSVHFLEI